MCIVFIAYGVHPLYPIVLLTNRDEEYERPSTCASFWTSYPDILAGKDLKGKGTWAGMNKSGRFAVLTNFRVPVHEEDFTKKTRGKIVFNFLSSTKSPLNYLEELSQSRELYQDYNVIIGDIVSDRIYYYSNRQNIIKQLEKGFVYGLSNAHLDTSWPKVDHGKALVQKLLEKSDFISDQDLIKAGISILTDTKTFEDKDLPNTGRTLEFERTLSTIFIKAEIYGTRAQTVLLASKIGKVTFAERSLTMDTEGKCSSESEWQINQFEFDLNSKS